MSINFKQQTSTEIIDTYWIIEEKINHTFDFSKKKKKEKKRKRKIFCGSFLSKFDKCKARKYS